jgi:para-nitrobenzyl esterase
MIRSIRAWLCLAAAAVTLPLHAANTEPVATTSGLLSGSLSTDKTIVAYRGIPYAAPPVGSLRWRAPAPAAAWSGVRKAEQFPASCVQDIVEERKPWTAEFMAHSAISEDCLYLNIWSPANRGDRLPVYFWIHGGGYREGAGDVPVYDARDLSRHGVVVVTINYRLGVLGFLAHPELQKESGRSGNYGSLDQLAALRWVQANIAGFGGDPGNVTIGGQSAGAASVHNLVASPLARGLFHRALTESGSGVVAASPYRSMAEAGRLNAQRLSATGAGDLASLRLLTPQQLALKLGAGNGGLRPVIDGYFLPADPNRIYAQGKQNDVPELTGMNRDERSSADDYGRIPAATYRKAMEQRFARAASGFFALYPNDTQETSGVAQKAALRDAGLVSMHLWARLRGTTGRTPAYTYYWTHVMPGADSERYGAFHTSEVPYIFGTLRKSMRPWTPRDEQLVATMGRYWANFIKSGDPNGTGLPAWPAYDAASPVTMELGDRLGPMPIGDRARVQFWERYLTHGRPVMN